MTTAPPNLLAVRKLLLEYLDVDPGKARSIDLESAEVGIVGDTAHISQGNSYHLGLPEQSKTGYAATESPRDKAGLCEYASALDVGTFTVTTPKGSYDLRHFSAWCVAQCSLDAADTRDIREIIWSPDGKTVRRWDDLGKRSSGDSSHLWHTHFSFYRDATKAGRDLTPLFRRYLTTIGLIQEDDMTPAEMLAAKIHNDVTNTDVPFGTFIRSFNNSLSRLEAGMALLQGKDFTDEDAIVRGVLAGLPAEKIAAAIPPELAKQVADELAGRLAS